MRTTDFLWKGVRKAQQIARHHGFNYGDTVAHPRDRKTYMFESVDGDMAIVSIPAEKTKDGKEIRKKFPLEGLFNPNVAKDWAVLAKARFLNFNPN